MAATSPRRSRKLAVKSSSWDEPSDSINAAATSKDGQRLLLIKFNDLRMPLAEFMLALACHVDAFGLFFTTNEATADRPSGLSHV